MIRQARYIRAKDEVKLNGGWWTVARVVTGPDSPAVILSLVTTDHAPFDGPGFAVVSTDADVEVEMR